MGSIYSQPACASTGTPKGSIPGPLFLLIHVNDMPKAVKCNLLLYADDTRLASQHKDINETEKQLYENFENICDCIVDNKLSIHFYPSLQMTKYSQ